MRLSLPQHQRYKSTDERTDEIDDIPVFKKSLLRRESWSKASRPLTRCSGLSSYCYWSRSPRCGSTKQGWPGVPVGHEASESHTKQTGSGGNSMHKGSNAWVSTVGLGNGVLPWGWNMGSREISLWEEVRGYQMSPEDKAQWPGWKKRLRLNKQGRLTLTVYPV